jgi:hypothetical protein
MSIDLTNVNKKALAIVIVLSVLTLVTLGLGITLFVKFMSEWKLIVSFAAIGAADAGLVAGLIYYLKKKLTNTTV